MRCFKCPYAIDSTGARLDDWSTRVICPFETGYKMGRDQCNHDKERIAKNKITSTELELCPFCGGIPTCEKDWREGDDESFDIRRHSRNMWTVKCDYFHDGCGISIGFFDRREDAVKKWNTRVEIPK